MVVSACCHRKGRGGKCAIYGREFARPGVPGWPSAMLLETVAPPGVEGMDLDVALEPPAGLVSRRGPTCLSDGAVRFFC